MHVFHQYLIAQVLSESTCSSTRLQQYGIHMIVVQLELGILLWTVI